MYYFIFIILSLFNYVLWGLEFGLDAKTDINIPIERFQLFAERCSGSNYIEALMQENSDLKADFAYGWKHFPAWIGFSKQDESNETSDFYTLAHNENCLFIVIFRNPYDWIRSLYLTPHHSAQHLRNLTFTEFIRTPWQLDDNDLTVQKERIRNPLVDKDPDTGNDFKNALQLRKAKIRTLLHLKERVYHIYYINYETLRDHPEQVIQEISKTFHIKIKDTFVNVKEYKGIKSNNLYFPKKYNPIIDCNLTYINSQLDAELETQIGYEIKQFYVD